MNISAGNSFSIAQQGLQRSQASAVEAAESIASPERLNGPSDVSPIDRPETASGTLEPLVQPIVQLKESQQLFDASAKVIEVSDRTIGALLDVSA
ncbi:hypothetical protein [uncultured Pseudoteredinibacter sp.]|uniref:hypothetical protein n=1 Tax=uncultured Pseudoteredinibacter sp. TaxID=1641701 RepID=UPI002625CBFA|nr:hypothetical protein [uncultured Pseudoteredinibacter sp.]